MFFLWLAACDGKKDPLLKPVILSSHLPDFKCNTFLQKLVFLLFSFINFQADTCRHTECQKVVINILQTLVKNRPVLQSWWFVQTVEVGIPLNYPLVWKFLPPRPGACHLNLLFTSLYSSNTSIALRAVLQIFGVSFGKHTRDGRCSVLDRCYWVPFLTTISSVEPGQQRTWTQIPAGFSEF